MNSANQKSHSARAAVTAADDERFMRDALVEAAVAKDKGEVPVGAVVVCGGEIVARGHNLRETSQDPTAHAELIALRAAAARFRSFRLEGATVYVTLEPCPMCAGALVNSRVARVVYGCGDPKAGALRSLYRLGEDTRLNHRYEVCSGILGEECAEQLSSFFARIRGARRGITR